MKRYDIAADELIEGCKMIEKRGNVDMPRNIDWSEYIYHDTVNGTTFSEDVMEGVFWRVKTWSNDYLIKFDHGYIHDFVKHEWNKCYNVFNEDNTYKNVIDKVVVILDTVYNYIIIRHITNDKEKILKNYVSNNFKMTVNNLYDRDMVDISSEAAYYKVQEMRINVKSFKRRDIEDLIFNVFTERKNLEDAMQTKFKEIEELKNKNKKIWKVMV